MAIVQQRSAMRISQAVEAMGFLRRVPAVRKA